MKKAHWLTLFLVYSGLASWAVLLRRTLRKEGR